MTEFIQGKFYKDDDTGEKLLFIKTVSGTISDTYMFYSYQQEGIQIYLNNTGISEWTEPMTETPPTKTLRDEFAMAVIAGVIGQYGDRDGYIKKSAEFAYKLADAMMKQREIKE